MKRQAKWTASSQQAEQNPSRLSPGAAWQAGLTAAWASGPQPATPAVAGLQASQLAGSAAAGAAGGPAPSAAGWQQAPALTPAQLCRVNTCGCQPSVSLHTGSQRCCHVQQPAQRELLDLTGSKWMRSSSTGCRWALRERSADAHLSLLAVTGCSRPLSWRTSCLQGVDLECGLRHRAQRGCARSPVLLIVPGSSVQHLKHSCNQFRHAECTQIRAEWHWQTPCC